MKPCILHIDTSDSEKTKISLELEDKTLFREGSSRHISSQTVLPMIETLLTESHLSMQDLTEVKVNPGPGSYTGLRVGAAIGNTISWMLGIPINGQAPGSLVELTY